MVNNFISGYLKRVDIQYDSTKEKINAFIFGENSNIIKLNVNQQNNQISMQTYSTGIRTESIEQISDLDGDGFNDYQMFEPSWYLLVNTAIFLTGSENPIINSNENITQSSVDFNGDGINDFVGIKGDNKKTTFFINTYDKQTNSFKTYWSFEENYELYSRNFYKPVTAIDNEHIMFYKIQDKGDVVLHKINIKTNEKTTVKLFSSYLNTNNSMGGMILAINQNVLFEINDNIYITEGDKLVSVIKGDRVNSYNNTILIEDQNYHTLTVTNINNINKNVTYKTLFYDSLKIDLNNVNFKVARIMSDRHWKELETTEKEFGYLINGKWNLIIVETFDEYGNVSFHVYKINKISILIKFGIIFISSLVVLSFIFFIKKIKGKKGGPINESN